MDATPADNHLSPALERGVGETSLDRAVRAMSGTDRRSAGDCKAPTSADNDEQRRFASASQSPGIHDDDVGDSEEVIRIPGVDQRCEAGHDSTRAHFSQSSTIGSCSQQNGQSLDGIANTPPGISHAADVEAHG